MKKYGLTLVALCFFLVPHLISTPATAETRAPAFTSSIPSPDYVVLQITGSAATGNEVLNYLKNMDLQGNKIKRLKIIGDMTTYGNQGVYTFHDLEELELDGTTEVPSFLAYQAPHLKTLIDTNKTIRAIGMYAFAYSGLEEVELNSVTSLDTGAFRECLSLTSFKSSTLTSLNNWGFSGCTLLTIFEAPNLSGAITSTALENTNIDTLDLPNITSVSPWMQLGDLKNLRVLKLNGISIAPRNFLNAINSERLEYVEIKNTAYAEQDIAFSTGSTNISNLLIHVSDKMNFDDISDTSLHTNTVVASPKGSTEQSIKEGDPLTISAFDFKTAPTTNVAFQWFKDNALFATTPSLLVTPQALSTHSGTITARFFINNQATPTSWPTSAEHIVSVLAGTIGFGAVYPIFSFEDFAISERDLLVKRRASSTGIQILDERFHKSDWEVHAKIKAPLTDPISARTLDNALVYVDETGNKTPLTNEALPVYKSTAKNNATEIQWAQDRGILLNIASQQAFVGKFSTEIQWELVLAP
ncbi:leucine-rich repeat protein [Listeria newyorkensis]|uniref:leucine-rich repeat protein n=1 Tax=Listeria newyorkensis TaxID=1497681 RepID=UPI00051D1ADD|nr:leucine-rich repeat domain-containing protein [Listeria newyorkensis]KGL43877.1 hypothetical protein EP58_05310 [Listeria newyorkensis]SQC59194.1 Uncharacterised protein [Listeria newyorkensis]